MLNTIGEYIGWPSLSLHYQMNKWVLLLALVPSIYSVYYGGDYGLTHHHHHYHHDSADQFIGDQHGGVHHHHGVGHSGHVESGHHVE